MIILLMFSDFYDVFLKFSDVDGEKIVIWG